MNVVSYGELGPVLDDVGYGWDPFATAVDRRMRILRSLVEEIRGGSVQAQPRLVGTYKKLG